MSRRTRWAVGLACLVLLSVAAFATWFAAALRHHLREDNVIWDFTMIATATASYAGENGGTLPGAVEDLFPHMFPPELLATDLRIHELFRSPFGPAPDGAPDYPFRTDLAGQPWESVPNTTILTLERAALLQNRPRITVLWANGGRQQLTIDELRAALHRPENQVLANQLAWP